MNRTQRYVLLGAIALTLAWLLNLGNATPAQAHWADLSAAEIVVKETTADMTLTFPTGLIASADDNRSGQLEVDEVQRHQQLLQSTLSEQIQMSNGNNQPGVLTIQSVDRAQLPVSIRTAPNTHSTLKLTYTWPNPLRGLRISYRFFLPGVSTASCLATILNNQSIQTFLFTPNRQTLTLAVGLPGLISGGIWMAIAGAFLWGAMHSLSPGHGKTIVGAYLVGTKATAGHALFLAATTTITHTLGVFVLGFLTLFASQYILPEILFPWLSAISGLMMAAIGIQLLRDRLKLNSTEINQTRSPRSATSLRSRRSLSSYLSAIRLNFDRHHAHHDHSHAHHDHSHAHHDHSHAHHDHSHAHHDHSHMHHDHSHAHHNHSHDNAGYSHDNVDHSYKNHIHSPGNVDHSPSNAGYCRVNVDHSRGNVAHSLGNAGYSPGNVGHSRGNVDHSPGSSVDSRVNIDHSRENPIHSLGNDEYSRGNAGHSRANPDHFHDNQTHSHETDHPVSTHAHHHPHSHHTHSHLPPDLDKDSLSWRSLMAIGISGGLVPCPAALVLLLSCISLGQTALGLGLVTVFSLGLAGVLTGLGLALVYTKHLFRRLPSSIRPIRIMSAVSAIAITFIGFALATRAIAQVITPT